MLAAQSRASSPPKTSGSALLALRSRTAITTVPAEVLHQSVPTDGRTLLLGTGPTPIKAGDPVISPEGLWLASASAPGSIAMTWAHPDFG
jgi:hypothetical protein